MHEVHGTLVCGVTWIAKSICFITLQEGNCIPQTMSPLRATRSRKLNNHVTNRKQVFFLCDAYMYETPRKQKFL